MSSHHGGQPTCTTVSLGKYVRRALRAAVGMKKKKKLKHPATAEMSDVSSSMERISSFSSEAAMGTAATAARKESVVRVVLKSGVVEVYPGVVLACTVIRKHPPGLCLAHPDVFRNPHGAVVRPLEPLFPGQKFLLLPETTVVRLKQKIPEGSIGAFADDDDEEEDLLDDYDSYHSSGAATASSSEEDEQDTAAVGDDGGGFMAGRSAREFYVANDRWSECQFKRMVECGLAIEQNTDQRPPVRRNVKAKNKKKRTSKRKNRRVTAPPAGSRTFSPPRRRMWEPSLPSVEEEEDEEDDC